MFAVPFPRYVGLLALSASATMGCEVSYTRTLWSKSPGSTSELFAYERFGKVGFIDATGKIVIRPIVDARIEDVGDFSNGRARIGDRGYINETGKLIIDFHPATLGQFSDGIASLSVWSRDPTKPLQSLLIDPEGSVLGNPTAASIQQFSEGLAGFTSEQPPFFPHGSGGSTFDGLQGFLDKSGEIRIAPTFAQVGPFQGGLARAVVDGKCRRENPGTDWQMSLSDTLSICQVGFLNHAGIFAIPAQFDSAKDFSEGLAAVAKHGSWGFIGAQGTTVLPFRWDEVMPFHEGLAAVRKNDRWGFINLTGELVIATRYQAVQSFSDGTALVSEGSGWAYIEKTGRTKIPKWFTEATPFVNGLAAVLIEPNHISYIDHSGDPVFEYHRRPQ